jgi:DNA-directed RNA polymerase subunit F
VGEKFMSITHGLLHQIAIAALTAVQEKVDRSQVNKLLEVLNAYDIDTLVVFMARQVAREEFGRCTSRHLVSIIETIVSEVKKHNIDVKVEVRKVLGYFKWFYEIFSELRSKALSEISKKYQGVLSCRESLASVKPEAYLELLKAALS